MVQNIFNPQNGPKWSKFGHFECFFYLHVQNSAINFYNFWHGNSPCVLLWKNHSVYAGKNPDMAKIWPFVAKVFVQNWQFESLWPITLKRCCESSLFLVRNIFLGLLWENLSLCAGKILIWRNFDHLSHFLAKIDRFESFGL